MNPELICAGNKNGHVFEIADRKNFVAGCWECDKQWYVFDLLLIYQRELEWSRNGNRD